MRENDMAKRVFMCVLAALLAVAFPAMAQEGYYQEGYNVEWWDASPQAYRPEQLDQMLAPIALYPDQLLAQVLSAATYPRSIAEANRLLRENPGLPNEALADVARDMNWAPSVKAMLQFPDVLAMMDKYPDWTSNLGNAFLSQQRDVIDSVQRLRQMAYDQGRLRTTQETVVRYDQQRYIFIEPANPQMVYVPVYDPQVIYGTWRYPQYQPQSYYYPSYSSSQASSTSSLISYLAGVLLGNESGWGGWNFDWQQRQANIQVAPYNTFVNRYYTSPELFQISSPNVRSIVYDTQFRRNAGFRDYTTAQSFVAQQASGLTRAATAGRSTDSLRAQSNLQSAKASEVSQAAHAAQSEGLKGKDLAEKVHEAIDTRKEARDALKAESKENIKDLKEKAKEEVKVLKEEAIEAKEQVKEQVKEAKENVKEKTKELKEKGKKGK